MSPHLLRLPLPQPRRQEVLALTEAGHRLHFASVAHMLRSTRRADRLVAVCLDNCAWREFDPFRDGVWHGLAPLDAFDKSPFYVGNLDKRSAREPRTQRVA